ncbi:hypothetical protein [uncultured Sunxiuqinia sp.]|uniref:hypothetical protein n=1 Tax=uncultured Sunxiuqinia sp. TaxID=1573825 RepID=UPI002AA5F569|nr:hypothetical protein [uncultured Sunxiuqinia sp.]
MNRYGQFACVIQYIGSDYDGMINPSNGFWTAEEMPLFDSYLEKHAFNFLNSEKAQSLEEFNKIKASDIVNRFTKENTYEFLKRNF